MHDGRGLVRLVIGLVSMLAIASCREGESNPHASQIVRHAEETREVLNNRAVQLGRGPTSWDQQEAIRELRESGRAIELRAQQQAATIRASGARGGGPTVAVATVQAIANARCEIEASCGAIGNGRRFDSAMACSRSLAREPYMGWRESSCTEHGFDGDRLDRCLAVVRAQRCEARSGPIQECRPEVVCPLN